MIEIEKGSGTFPKERPRIQGSGKDKESDVASSKFEGAKRAFGGTGQTLAEVLVLARDTK